MHNIYSYGLITLCELLNVLSCDIYNVLWLHLWTLDCWCGTSTLDRVTRPSTRQNSFIPRLLPSQVRSARDSGAAAPNHTSISPSQQKKKRPSMAIWINQGIWKLGHGADPQVRQGVGLPEPLQSLPQVCHHLVQISPLPPRFCSVLLQMSPGSHPTPMGRALPLRLAPANAA
jgi:hypothetical protein